MRSPSAWTSSRAAAARGVEGSNSTLPRSAFHAPATAPSTVKVGRDCGILVWKIRGRLLLGEDALAAGVHGSVASQVGS